MKQMSEIELKSIVDRAEKDAAIYNGELNALNARLLEDYLGEPYGDEVEDQSQVISTDVQDVVESDMAALSNVFLSSKQPIVFEPTGASEQEAQEIEEKNQYVNYLIMNQSNSYQTLFNWMKEATIQKSSVVKYFMDDCRKTREVNFENVDESEFYQIVESLPENSEIVGQSPNEDGTYNLSFRVTEGEHKLEIVNVPCESFLITKGASCLDDAILVGDKVSKTRGELLAEGYKRSLIEQLPTNSSDETDEIEVIRHQDTGRDTHTYSDWANEKVELRDLYVKIDYDGDGIAERRHILKSGNHILLNEAFDHVPYASLSGILMPHQVIGRSRGELVQKLQRKKTVVERGMMNNIYMVNNPRNVVHPDINIDDMLQVRPNGVVRMKRGTTILPGNAVANLSTEYTADRSLQVINYLDYNRSNTTGMIQTNQGLEGDAISEETATRFKGVMEQGRELIGTVTRNFAETGWRKLYEGVAWTVSQYQDSETEIMVLGKPLTVNPQSWKYGHNLVCKVGTGSGDNDKLLESMSSILSIQYQLQQMQSPLVDQVKFYNTLIEMVEGLGIKQTDKFFNNPEQPEQLIQAENEILKGQLMQMQQMAQQNPLAEAEMIKQQAFLTKAQSDAQIKAAELTEKVREFDEKLAADSEKHDKDLALKLTELEQKVGEQLDKELADNVLTFNPETGNFEGQI